MGEKRKIIEEQAETIRILQEEQELNKELYQQILIDVLKLIDENILLTQQVEDLRQELQNTNIPILSNTKNELTPFIFTVANKIDEYMNNIQRKYREYYGSI